MIVRLCAKCVHSGSRHSELTGSLLQAIRDSFGVEDQNAYFLNNGLGLRFQLQDTTDVLSLDSKTFDRALSRKSQELQEFLAGRPDEDRTGLIDSLSTALDAALDKLVAQLDPVQQGGLLLDRRA